MIQFEEPEDKYDFDPVKQKEIKTKIRVFSLFIIFLMLIVFAIKNDFSFEVGINKDIGFACSGDNTLKKGDDDELKAIKAEKALKDNEESLSKIKGFEEVVIDSEKTYNGGNRPIFKIIFNNEYPEHSNIPDDLCGFSLEFKY
ncbi:MAG: hypothetical protein ACOCUF_00700 [Patescibacteria group bacterium]